MVRTLGLADTERDRFAPRIAALREANIKVGNVSGVFDPLLELLPTGAILAVLVVGAGRVVDGSLTVGTLVEVVYLLLTITIPLSVISRFLGMLPMSAAGGERVSAVLASGEEPAHGDRVLPEGAATAVSVRGAGLIRGGTHVLRDVSFDLFPGEVVAVVGATGSGKTSICELVVRLTDSHSGSVTHNDIPVAEFAETAISAGTALVPQTAFLFTGSVRENVTMWNDHSDDEVWEALRQARIDEFVRGRADGLDHAVGEMGAGLSGGQRQRIALARALIRRPRSWSSTTPPPRSTRWSRPRFSRASPPWQRHRTDRRSWWSRHDPIRSLSPIACCSCATAPSWTVARTTTSRPGRTTTAGSSPPIPPGQQTCTPMPRRAMPALADLSAASPLSLVRTGIRLTPVLVSGLLVTTIAAVMAGAGQIVAPLTVQYAIDHGLSDPDHPHSSVVTNAVAVGGAALVVAALASMLMNVRLYRRVELACESLRAKGLARIHSMDQATVATSRNADLMSRLTSDVDTVSTFAQTGGVVLLTNIAQMLIAAAVVPNATFTISLSTPVARRYRSRPPPPTTVPWRRPTTPPWRRQW